MSQQGVRDFITEDERKFLVFLRDKAIDHEDPEKWCSRMILEQWEVMRLRLNVRPTLKVGSPEWASFFTGFLWGMDLGAKI